MVDNHGPNCLAVATVGCPFVFTDAVTGSCCAESLECWDSDDSPPYTGADFVPETQKSGTYKVEPGFTWGLLHCGDTVGGGCTIAPEFLLH